MRFLICILFIFIQANLIAQSKQFKFGYGNYEGFHIGLRHSYDKLSVEYGFGTDFNMFQQGLYSNIHIALGKRTLKQPINNGIQLFTNLKTVVWHIDNSSNSFSAVALSAESQLKIAITEQFQLGVHGGVIWSSVFRYRRKTYREIGFPKEWQPNFGLCLYYTLK